MKLFCHREVLFLSLIDKITYEFQIFNGISDAFCIRIFTGPYRNEF